MKIPSVKGFRDILAAEGRRRQVLESRARAVFDAYAFGEIRIPIVERTELFRRSIGASTDIVEKEMYTFADQDGTSLTLRPEGTAPVARAYVEHALHQREPVSKLYYMGPMFRRERPQRGRMRQFYQIGAELIGREDPAADAEMLLLLYDLLEAFGVETAVVQVNTLGCRECRPGFRAAVVAWGRERTEELCGDCVRRIEQNPLRLLDCKRPGCVAARESAPRMVDHACGDCRAHFDRVLALLGTQGRRPAVQPYMVRGLDYYCRTAFEVIAEGLGAQNAIGGGGRYDGLVHDLGGPAVAGVGFALGVERILMTLAEDAAGEPRAPEFFVAPIGAVAEEAALGVAQRLRGEGARVEMGSVGKSLKSQMRHAGKLAARYVLIIGEDEVAGGALTVRDMTARRDHPLAFPLAVTGCELRAALASL